MVEKGHIVIGEANQTGDMRDAVIAKNNIDLAVADGGSGTVTVYGVIDANEGDVMMTAASESYDDGQRNIIIDAYSRIHGGQDVNLTATKGDIHVSDVVSAGRDLNVKTVTEGSVFFDTDLEAVNDINLSVDKGDIHVGHKVTSTGGSITAAAGEGDISIGYTGYGLESAGTIIDTVYADKDVTLRTGLGKVLEMSRHRNGKSVLDGFGRSEELLLPVADQDKVIPAPGKLPRELQPHAGAASCHQCFHIPALLTNKFSN